MSINLIKLEEILKQINTFDLTKNNDTYFDILGYGHYENINSNILSYYLSSENGHNLYRYFIESLFELLDIKENISTFSKTIREYTTLKGGRLDILIETNEFVIGIENKIYHSVDNDLDDYKETISKIAEKGKKQAILCLLSLDSISNFLIKNILHIDLWNKIFEKIEFNKFILDKHIVLLNEVKENIEFITKGKKMDIEQIEFLQNNADNIKKLMDLKDNFGKELEQKAISLKNKIDSFIEDDKFIQTKYIRFKSGNFLNDYIVVIDFVFNNINIAIDIVLDIYERWQLYFYERNSGKLIKELDEILKQKKVSFQEEKYDSCYRAKILETQDMDNIVTFLNNLFNEFKQSK